MTGYVNHVYNKASDAGYRHRRCVLNDIFITAGDFFPGSMNFEG